MAEYIPIDKNTDIIDDETKVTAGYFTGNLGTLAKGNLTTGSKSSTQKTYYQDLLYSSEEQFSVAFGHKEGSGSGAANETKAIYRMFKTLLVNPQDIAGTSSNGFQFKGSHPTSGSEDGVVSAKAGDSLEDYMYFIVADRARMKDKINPKNWTLNLSASVDKIVDSEASTDGSGSILTLTDDSSTTTGTSTVAGTRYNVVSGSDGSVIAASSSKYYGWFYPQMGVIALRGNMLSGSPSNPGWAGSSLNGTPGAIDSGSFGDSGSAGAQIGIGLAPELTNDGTAQNHIKLGRAMKLGEQKFRSEEIQKSKSYFIRAFANDMNFSNNPTFTSGSDMIIANEEMIGYPSSFITTVGLYQGQPPQLVAVGKLSGPVEKNYGTEATIKVKLTY